MTTSGTVLSEVLQELDIQYSYIDTDEVVFAIELGDKTHFIINNILGLNSESDVKICSDKAYTFDVLRDVVSMPHTKKYLDPDGPYARYAEFEHLDAILADTAENFVFPFIVKKNSGSLGSQVFWCEDAAAVAKAAHSIFNRNSHSYDHVLLAQQGISIATEWRVLMLYGQLEFMYQKDVSQATFSGNLSPLHWDEGRAVLDTDVTTQQEIQQFLNPIFSKWQLPYGGFDVVRDTAGKLWLIEVNSHPAFSIFLRDNEATPLKNMYKKILKELAHDQTSNT